MAHQEFHPGQLSVLLTIIALTAGCSSQYGATVHGTVTLDGKLVTHGVVSFHPAGGGPIALARIEENGSFRLHTGKANGVVPGEYVVTITSLERSPDPGMTAAQVDSLRITPGRYASIKTTNLTADIQSGDNRIDLPLQSD